MLGMLDTSTAGFGIKILTCSFLGLGGFGLVAFFLGGVFWGFFVVGFFGVFLLVCFFFLIYTQCT